MDLETVIQSEVSQKEKNKYRILMHICGTQKNGTGELVCRAEIETDVENKHMDTKGGKRQGWWWCDELGEDRKSVVQGKSVDLGGRRIIKKKIEKTYLLKNNN